MSFDVQIKGTRQGLVICLPPAEFEDIKADLRKKMEQACGFFRGAQFMFRSAVNPISDDQQQELEQLLSGYGLMPVKRSAEYPLERQVVRPVSRPAVTCAVATGVECSRPAILVPHGLRSGQDAHFEGDVVVLGGINPGARVSAGGNVIVLGCCAGTICAGSGGNKQAVVAAFAFSSPNLSIAGIPSGNLITPSGGQKLYTAVLTAGGTIKLKEQEPR